MGSQPSHAKAGNLGPRLHQAAMEADANASASGEDTSTQHERCDKDPQHMGGGPEQQQRRSMALPKRPLSIRKTPLPGSAQEASALDMDAVSILPCLSAWESYATSLALSSVARYCCPSTSHT